MSENYQESLKKYLDEKNLEKLMAIKVPAVHKFVAEYVERCQPKTVFVRNDSDEDADYIRNIAIEDGSEAKMATEGHTIHFDGAGDQARDAKHTAYLVEEGVDMGSRINTKLKSEGLPEVLEFLEGSMKDREMYVVFHTLGPAKSVFSIPVMQITDSSYVAHSLSLLYRRGYGEFTNMKEDGDFFRVIHTQGELVVGENNAPVCKNLDKRRIYIDLEDSIVYSTNTQYAGNTVGLKKLSFRMAIRKASMEGWLAEHMFLSAVPGKGDRWTYFAGAFPSACGKTSTAMIPGQKIIGDDLAYLRKVDGKVMAANTESGIFGIIENVNPDDDPVIYSTLDNPGEIIFSNVLIKDGKPYWKGMGMDMPKDGINWYGKYTEGMTDDAGNAIQGNHKNSRYTVRLSDLENCDPAYEDPKGVELGGVVYGGRDSDTHVPVTESFDWEHGTVTMGASIESETTAATLGSTGQRKFNLMSIIEFLSMPLGQYLKMHFDFAKDGGVPKVFGVNYFLKKDGKFLNGILDKKVWMRWAEGRAHGEFDAIKGPTGYLPKYEDLQALFKSDLNKEYTKEDYVEQFTLRIPELLAKNERIVEIYKNEKDVPAKFFDIMEAQKARLLQIQSEKGDYVSPEDLTGCSGCCGCGH